MRFLYASSLFSLIVITASLNACTSHPKDISLSSPALDPKVFFTGQLQANGIVQDYKGKQLRSFTADIVGQWNGSHGLLDEHFVFNDGEEQYRCWQLTVDGQKLLGRAGDVIGLAEGEFIGNTLSWTYTLQLPEQQGGWKLELDDRLFLLTQNKLINKTRLKKFGLPVGEIILMIDKLDTTPRRALAESCSTIEGA